MNPRSLPLLAALALGFHAGIAGHAAEIPAAKPEDRPAVRSGLTNRTDRVKALAAELKLTPQQQEKLRPILQEEAMKSVEIYREPNLSREARMAKIKELRDANREKVRVILTPEQLVQWDKMRQGRQLQPPQRVRPASK